MTATHEGTDTNAPLLPQDSSIEDALLQCILKSLDDSKAEEIVSLDLAGKTSVADFMVVASGRSHRHVGAVTDHLLRDLKEAGYGNARVEGLPHCDWVLVDIGDAIIHIFRPEVRGFYNVEKMWSTETTEPTQYIG
ncbi:MULTISPECIES: ribosome silencing factor [Pseudovibrio]|uniref:ribosome silencing factor n=1 Tax=Stappiaceae TaxID=2821832 RepID=UPI0023653DC8|nr:MULTISPECIES: ribosome silencing factor [Pseudovibrio]MDD7909823.1 ribosome silencing factor [Pseudovibrio exalbescens]MDX5592163.1 ribosome silencing factor [Pseudovibrio sp. SPO723]